jgi:hypothetical protein
MDKLETKQGSFIQQTQYLIPDSRSGGNQCLVIDAKFKLVFCAKYDRGLYLGF